MNETLNDIMPFDHVIEVKPDGSIVDRPDVFAPGLYDDELGSDGWTLLDGFSGQDRYSGPIMNDAEFIGGGMERYIRETPGVYVALVSNYSSDADGNTDENEDYAEGWAVAFRETDSVPSPAST